MAVFEMSVEINRPVEEVFSFFSNLDNRRQWILGLEELEQTSEGPVGVGTTWRDTVRAMGRRMESTAEITGYEPNKQWKEKGSSGSIQGEVNITFDSVEGGTRVSGLADLKIGGFLKLASPIVTRTLKKRMQADINRLKAVLEAQA